MKERPILFSGQMVNAIRDGRKTQTRRKCKRTDAGRVRLSGSRKNWHIEDPNAVLACPYGQPGDKLWCRETWAPHADMPGQYIYRADRGGDYQDTVTPNFRWRPSIFMPRWASRILLEITAVRVERLQDISEEDAKAEGATQMARMGDAFVTTRIGSAFDGASFRDGYQWLWKSINGPGSWEANPWVWVIEFKVLEV